MVKEEMNNISKKLLLLCYIFFSLTWYFFYPKWENSRTEATISWDVSGYYLYLPATFIYKDVKELKFLDSIIAKYGPTPGIQQAFKHSGGNYVMKYSSGQALIYSPFFLMGHFAAIVFDYPTDGFSLPYQFFISFGSLIIAFIGLWFLRKILLEYFDDWVAGITLVFIFFGTNYLNYSVVDGAMTHNSLFSIYCILIYLTIQFYKTPTFLKASAIGFLIGLAALTRPTEILTCLIPLLWNFKLPLKSGIAEKITFIRNNYSKLIAAIVICGMVGSIQLFYWKYVSGDWVVYSYEDQGFSWLHPHLYAGILSYRAGWLVYTPLMVFAFIGFIPLYIYKRQLFWSIGIYAAIFIYITFAWDIWWYGGGLGQRAMVQCYPVLAFPIAGLVSMVMRVRYLKMALVTVSIVFIYHNLWFTYQAHGGELFHVDQMTQGYYWKTVGRFQASTEYLKLLDTEDLYEGVRKDVVKIYSNNFESDTINYSCEIAAIEGNRSLCIDASNQFSPTYFAAITNNDAEWIRVGANFRCKNKEWDVWRMSQFIVKFYNNDTEVKTSVLRVYRFLNDGDTRYIYKDVKLPKEVFNKVGVFFWNGEGDKPLVIDGLEIEKFNEE